MNEFGALRLVPTMPFTLIPGEGTLLLLGGEEVRLTLEGDHESRWLVDLWPRLDGSRSVDALLGMVPPGSRAVVREAMVALLGERVLRRAEPQEFASPGRFSARVVEVSNPLADAVARVAHRSEPSSVPTRDLPILCQTTLDYASARTFERNVESEAWMWVTIGPLARGFVGPIFLKGEGPCLGCLLASFRRLSPEPEIYDALAAHASRGGSFAEAEWTEEGRGLLASLVMSKIRAAEAASAAAYTLHVLELSTLEVSSHEVTVDPDCDGHRV